MTDFERALEHLADERAVIRPSHLFPFSGMSPEEARLFARRWSTLTLERRRQVMRWLAEIAEEDFQTDFGAAFRLGLADEDAEVRAAAIDGLWEDDDEALVPSLVRLLREDSSELVRSRAATALGRFAYLAEIEELKEAQPTLVKEVLLGAIRDSEETLEVRRRAVEAVSFFGGEEIRGLIETAYYDDEDQMRVSAVFAMGRNADSYWSDLVQEELGSPSREMRSEAARACGEIGVRKAIQALLALLEDEDQEVREAAIWSLGQIGGPRARRALEALCEGEDEMLAAAAEEALAELEFGESLPEEPLAEWFVDEEDEDGNPD